MSRRAVIACLVTGLLVGGARADGPPPMGPKALPPMGPKALPPMGPKALPRLTRPARDWRRDWIGWALTAAGGFALVVSATDFGVTEPRWANANRSWQDFASAQDTPGRLAADLVGLSIGVALVAGGVVRFVLVSRQARRDRERFAFEPAGAAWRF